MNSETFNVCEEMVIEILRRLPVKSLVRFTAVCRRWKSIITGPKFSLESSTTKLLVHSGEECYALVEGDEDDEILVLSETVEFPFKHWLRSAFVVGSGNGLVCIGITREGTPYNIIIWNPSIRRHAVIPPNMDGLNGNLIMSQGFGATISSKDYKYVRIVALYDGDKDKEMAFDIYSWKTGTWRRIYLDFDLYEHKFFSSKGAASLRGRIHWAAAERSKKINSISAFDLEDEVFDQDIMLPECFSSVYYFLDNVTLFVTKESQLSMIVIEDEPNRVMRCCSLWVMQEYGDVNSWTNLFLLDVAAIDRVFQDEPYFNEDCIRGVLRNAMVHLLKNGELLLGLKFYPPKLVKYNLKTSKATDIRGVSSSSQLCGFTNYYKESLAFLQRRMILACVQTKRSCPGSTGHEELNVFFLKFKSFYQQIIFHSFGQQVGDVSSFHSM